MEKCEVYEKNQNHAVLQNDGKKYTKCFEHFSDSHCLLMISLNGLNVTLKIRSLLDIWAFILQRVFCTPGGCRWLTCGGRHGAWCSGTEPQAYYQRNLREHRYSPATTVFYLVAKIICLHIESQMAMKVILAPYKEERDLWIRYS